jgi:osmoprotectant transport system ATP-binding protein
VAGGEGAAVVFDHVVKQYESGQKAVDDVSLEIPRGSFAVFVGPSGSGKTTLLRTVNRMVELTSGRVLVDDVDTASTDPVRLRRGIGYVIQQIGLFAHMTVAQNIAVVPSLLGWEKARTSARVDELLELVHLEPARYRARYPAQLSGGEAQRVGIARALAADPQIMLMDEPFGALDAIERERLQGEIAEIQARLAKTVLFVTHDVAEALRLASLLVVMRAGRIEQSGAPLAIMQGPANAFVGALLNADDVLQRFSVIKVAAVMSAGMTQPASGQRIGAERDLRTALSLMLATGVESLLVVDARGTPLGLVTMNDLKRAARPRTETAERPH